MTPTRTTHSEARRCYGARALFTNDDASPIDPISQLASLILAHQSAKLRFLRRDAAPTVVHMRGHVLNACSNRNCWVGKCLWVVLTSKWRPGCPLSALTIRGRVEVCSGCGCGTVGSWPESEHNFGAISSAVRKLFVGKLFPIFNHTTPMGFWFRGAIWCH